MTLNEKLQGLQARLRKQKAKIMIAGLGSVGCYLLDYLLSQGDENTEITVVGRNSDKMVSDVNIVKVAALIRGQNKSQVRIVSDVDLNDVNAIAHCIEAVRPDIIVNSSRAYAGLKYGSISWNNIRAYGIWSPLAVRYIEKIMTAYQQVGSDAIVINTSYSDAVIPWLKSAGRAYPDFGSGNVNHLIPRIKLAAAQQCGIEDFWNVDVTYAVSHFHDVVISKEGHTENVSQLIRVAYRGQPLPVDLTKLFSACKIAMPVDAKRNMMNASSNFEIIKAILNAVRHGQKTKLHCPGVFGEIGGYPVVIDGQGDTVRAYIDESAFSLDEMRAKNRQSIELDGIEDVRDGTLYYTDALLQKVERVFKTRLPKAVALDEAGDAAQKIIDEIIEKHKEK